MFVLVKNKKGEDIGYPLLEIYLINIIYLILLIFML